jgi:hypothetical protein
MAAAEEWPPCVLTDAMACLDATVVLSGDRVTLCFPTISACDWGISDLQKTSADIKPGSERCYLYRVK